MKRYPFMLSFLTVMIMLSLSACGYKPSSKYARSVVGSKINTQVTISAIDPQNTVLIKDAVDSAIVEVFHASLTDKTHADTVLHFSLNPPSYSAIQYNTNGYIIGYRATIILKIRRESKNIKKTTQQKGRMIFRLYRMPL